MYERFYNLRERPFALSPDPEYLYLSRVHREALDHLRYGVESRAGFIIITGEIGAGKTTLLQSLLQRLDERTVVARIVNTTLEPRELLETILIDFGLETSNKSKPALLRDLGQFLVQQRTVGRRPLLVVDEAQNLTAAALEEIRLLSNLETEKSKLLQILLVGQPNLRDTIASPELEQFRQRVAVSYHLTALDAPDTAAYINYRLEHAAIGEPMRFPADAADLVHSLSGGVPRIINVICDAGLVFGYAEERRNIERGLIQEVVRELESTGVLRQKHPFAADHMAAPSRREGIALVAGPGLTSPGDGRRTTLAPAPAGVAAEAYRSDSEHEAAQAMQLIAAREAELLHQRDVMVRRQHDLAAREEALAKRERQIAEQRRIMNEEYRLLRQRQPAASAAGASQAGRRASQPSPGSGLGGSQRVPGMLSSHARVNEPRHAAFWHWITRLFSREPVLRS